jgi:D-inositol-3-phosphate glycosyltransferase
VVGVASDVGGVPELARDPELGTVDAAVLVPPGDVVALSKTLAALMDDAARRRAIGAAARQLAARRAWPTIAERYERLYQRDLPAQQRTGSQTTIRTQEPTTADTRSGQ